MVEITHKLNGARVLHTCHSRGVSVVIAIPTCIFVMGHA